MPPSGNNQRNTNMRQMEEQKYEYQPQKREAPQRRVPA